MIFIKQKNSIIKPKNPSDEIRTKTNKSLKFLSLFNIAIPIFASVFQGLIVNSFLMSGKVSFSHFEGASPTLAVIAFSFAVVFARLSLHGKELSAEIIGFGLIVRDQDDRLSFGIFQVCLK